MSRITIGARPRLSSSQSRMRGFNIRLRPIATICCWPPENADKPACHTPLPQNGKKPVDRGEVPRAAVRRP